VLNGRKVDIVIDDGFHSHETIFNTLNALNEFLAGKFVYFIEDNSTVYKKLLSQTSDKRFFSYGALTVGTERS
jgi:hypothetical protein